MDANFHLGKLTKNTDPTPFCLFDNRGFFKSDEVFELYLKEHGADDLEVFRYLFVSLSLQTDTYFHLENYVFELRRR